jgi:histidinol-phosphate aminotransferase
VSVPTHGYGDYAHAAQAWGLGITAYPAKAQLTWACEPSSPLGGAHAPWPVAHSKVVLDCAYEPLRLSGKSSLSAAQRDSIWQLWTPNKALGLTGVRAAYAIAPQGAQEDALALEQLAASWPVGAHGVALLTAWTDQGVQGWLAESLVTLKNWKARQIDLLQSFGWTCLPSESNFFCAYPQNQMDLAAILLRLREQGIKLRDTTSFGMPNHARISVQTPLAQDALATALKDMQ